MGEVEELRAEIERLTDAELANWVSPAAKRFGDRFLARAEAAESAVEELRAEVERLRVARAEWRDAAQKRFARAEAAEARLRKVEALADEEEAKSYLKPPLMDGTRFPAIVSVRALRAALEAEPEVTPPAEQRVEGGA